MDFGVEHPLKVLESIEPMESEIESVWKSGADILPNKRGRKMVRKRSMKGLRVDKRLKLRKDQPSFVLDSISIHDKLQTQPDMERLITQVSNCENNSLQHNSTIEPAVNAPQQARARVARASQERKAYAERQQESDSFTKRFVNLGNFIQNQFASENRRRVRT